jgi:high-affinity iron transporter
VFNLSIAFQSGAILLREGLEALLVIAALSAFLVRAGAGHATRALYAGAGAAVVASIAAAAVFEAFLNGAHDDRLEAAVMVVAAALMLYMSGWLYLKQDPRAWTAELKASADRALSSGTRFSLAAVAFLAVFREGGETVLFLHALAGTSEGWTLGLIAGLGVAAVLLAGIGYAIQKLALKLPLRPVFVVTSAFLFVMGLRFVGGAIQELQEQAILPVHEAGELGDWATAIGFNGSWEALAMQFVLAVIAVSSIALLRSGQPQTARS